MVATVLWVSLSGAWPAREAEATVLQGRLTVPSLPPGHGPRANPYPGRAAALPHAEHISAGAVGDAVVYVETVPATVLAPEPEALPRLEQKGQTFVPRVLAVAVGTVVDFPNRDPIYHNVFSVSPVKRFDLGKYPKGQSRRVRFDKSGLVQVFCDIHSDMSAFVLVLPHHVFARPDAEGRFQLPDLPEGTYTLRVWHPDFGDLEQDISLTAGSPPVEVRY